MTCKAQGAVAGGGHRGTREGLLSDETVKWGIYDCSCDVDGSTYTFHGPGRSYGDLKGVYTYHSPYKQTINSFDIDLNSGFDRWKYETFVESFENNYQSIPEHLKPK